MEKISNLNEISVIIPVYNEKYSLNQLFSELTEALGKIGKSYEIIFCNDGSTDGSEDILNAFAAKDRRIRVINFRRRYGQTAAISSGFDFAQGDIIITMDGDLQNDPADIPQMLFKMQEGYDAVSGWRYLRQGNILTRRLPSRIANALISAIFRIKIHDIGCTLKAYRKEFVKEISMYGEMHRFIPIFIKGMGGRVGEVKVNDRKRNYGESKYGIMRTPAVIFDLVVLFFLSGYIFRPIQFFGKISLFVFLASFLVGLHTLHLRIVKAIPGLLLLPLVLLTMLLIIMGIHFFLMGLLAEIGIRTYYESQRKSVYLIKNTMNINSDRSPI